MAAKLRGERCWSRRRIDLDLRTLRCENGRREVVPRIDNASRGRRRTRGAHRRVDDVRGWGVSAPCQTVDGHREGPNVRGAVQLPGTALEGFLCREDEVPFGHENLFDPMHAGVQKGAVRCMLRCGEIFERDAQVSPRKWPPGWMK